MTCAATNNVLCVLEASTNLVQWTKLSVRTNTNGTVLFDDPGATNWPERFYRAVVPSPGTRNQTSCLPWKGRRNGSI